MSIEEVINKLFRLRGANRIEIVDVSSHSGSVTFRDIGTNRTYFTRNGDGSGWSVFELEINDVVSHTKFSKYFEGLLAGKTRNDAGELV